MAGMPKEPVALVKRSKEFVALVRVPKMFAALVRILMELVGLIWLLKVFSVSVTKPKTAHLASQPWKQSYIRVRLVYSSSN